MRQYVHALCIFGIAVVACGCAVVDREAPAPANTSATSRTVTQPSEPLVPLTSDDGRDMLTRSQYRNDFTDLSQTFTTQDNLAFCGPASAAMVLNALQIERPVSASHGEFKLFNQDNIFLPSLPQELGYDQVSRRGLTLAQFSSLLTHNGAQVQTVHADESTLDVFREHAKRVLQDPNQFLIINYKRAELGQAFGGHISPIAAYDEAEDRFLILDVSRYKYPSVWVSGVDLWRAMLNVDGDSSRSRGYVLVSAK